MSQVNAAEQARWNDSERVRWWPQREALTTLLIDELIGAVDPEPGQRALDIGCGAGSTLAALAERVGPSGLVAGADLSVPLLDIARSRIAAAGLDQVRVQLADVQVADIDGAPFDRASSKFGVMFFDDPVAAFTNIARHLRPGARLAFLCWRDPELNPWAPVPVLADFVPPAPAAPAYSLAEPGRVHEVLGAAGFSRIDVSAREQESEVGLEAIVNLDQLESMGVVPDRTAAATAVLLAHYEQFRGADGRYRVPLAYNLVTAVRPS